MSVSAQDVKKLREMTSAGMMDCKKALVETGGDFDAAVEFLQKKGLAKAATKGDRVAAEGLVNVWVSADERQAVAVEVNCETDFVARNEQFLAFVDEVTTLIGESGVSSVDELGAVMIQGVSVPEYALKQTVTIGEKIEVRRVARASVSEGVIGQYIHAGGKIAVLTAVAGATGEEAKQFARDVAMHVAAMKPAYLSPSDVDDASAAKQEEIFTAITLEEGKPANIVPKIVEGKMRKWRNESSLLEQPFVKNPEVTVGQFQGQVGGVTLQGFVRLEVGEGIEKQASNLADEVAAQLKG